MAGEEEHDDADEEAPAHPQPVGWGNYVVADGESLDSIGFRLGFFPDTIWNHPDNAEVKRVRKDRNILLPGDRLTIPAKTLGSESVPTGRLHTFRRRGVPSVFRMQVMRQGRPRANEPYELTVDGSVFCGSTDAEGRIEHWIPPDATRGQFAMHGLAREIRFGTLAPITEVKGVQQRLNNLGHACGRADGVVDTPTRAAVASLQRRVGITESGEIDDDTRRRLEALHDEVG